jgi:hypothetical protein
MLRMDFWRSDSINTINSIELVDKSIKKYLLPNSFKKNISIGDFSG